MEAQGNALRSVLRGEQEVVEGVMRRKASPSSLRGTASLPLVARGDEGTTKDAQGHFPQLQSISFVRPDETILGDGLLHSMTYSASPYSADGELVLHSGIFSTSWTKQKRYQASHNQFDACPPLRRSLIHTIRTIRTRIIRSLANSPSTSPSVKPKRSSDFNGGVNFWLAMLDVPMFPPSHTIRSSAISATEISDGGALDSAPHQPYRPYSERRSAFGGPGLFTTAGMALGTIGGSMMGKAVCNAGILGQSAHLMGAVLGAGAVAVVGSL